MQKGTLLAVLLFTLAGISTALNLSPVTPQIEGIYALVKRQIPQHADAFTFTLVNASTLDEYDAFTLKDTNDEGKTGISVECTSVSACARGLYTCV